MSVRKFESKKSKDAEILHIFLVQMKFNLQTQRKPIDRKPTAHLKKN